MGEQPLAGSHGDRMDPYLVAVNQVGCRQGMYELAAARDDDRPTWLALQLLHSSFQVIAGDDRGAGPRSLLKGA